MFDDIRIHLTVWFPRQIYSLDAALNGGRPAFSLPGKLQPVTISPYFSASRNWVRSWSTDPYLIPNDPISSARWETHFLIVSGSAYSIVFLSLIFFKITDYDLGDGNSTPRGTWCNVSTTTTSVSYLGPSTSHAVSIMSCHNMGKGAAVWSCQLTTG